MKSILKLVLGIVAGLVVGGIVNMALVMASGHVIPPPLGADMTTAEGIRAALPELAPRHFLFPFLAHALGTLAGAYIAAKIASGHRLVAAIVVAAFFFVGGIMAARMIPAPTWFVVLDIAVAYFPFGWAGCLLARPRLVEAARDV